MSFTGDPVVVISDPGDIEILNYVDTGVGTTAQAVVQRFDRETYSAATMYIKFVPGAGAGSFTLTWGESNDTGAIASADYVDKTTERFGGAITGSTATSYLYSIDLQEVSVAKYVEITPTVTNASDNSDITIIVRLRR
jgi:hypothetical protein